jgi:hypothetical protein
MRERLVDDMLVGGTSVVVCWARACGDRAAGLEVNFQKSETIEPLGFFTTSSAGPRVEIQFSAQE